MRKFTGLVLLLMLGVFVFPAFGFDEFKIDVTFGPDGESAQFAAVDMDGKLWVTDYGTPGNQGVRVFNSDTTEADYSPITTGLDENGVSVDVQHPGGVAYHDSIVYIISYDNKKILRYNAVDGTPLNGFAIGFSAGDLDIDDNGFIFVAYKVAAQFAVFDIDGNELKGSPLGVTGWHINRGLSVTDDGTKIFLADESDDVIAMWEGSIINGDSVSYTEGTDFMTGLNNPSACEIDDDGNMWISNTGGNEIIVAQMDGTVLQTITDLSTPRGAAFDFANNTAYAIHFDSGHKMVTRLKSIPEVTIADIQTTPDGEAGPSPYADQVVKTTGIVTALKSNAYWIQDAGGPWNGLYVYDSNTPAVGDEVTITGTVTEYFDLTEMKDITEFTVNSAGNTLPAAEIVTTGDFPHEKYESVLVKVENAECTDPDLGYGEWELDDGSGPAVVDDLLFGYAPDSAWTYNVTGVSYYSYGAFKLEPRDGNDIEKLTGPIVPVDSWVKDGEFGPSGESAQYCAVDGEGKLWVTNYGAPGTQGLHVFSVDTMEVDFSPITTGLDETGAEVDVLHPGGVAFHDGIVYVISYDNKKILRYNAADGTPLNGFALGFSPGDVDIDDNGNIFVCYKVAAQFAVYDKDGNEMKGSPLGAAGWHINRGMSVTGDGSKVFLADESSDVIALWEGSIINGDSVSYTQGADFMTGLSNPSACEIDAAGRMWISNSSANEVIIAELDGTVLQTIPDLLNPRGAAVDYTNKAAYVVHFTGSNKMATKLVEGVPVVVEDIASVKVDSDADFVPDRLGETVTITGVITSPNFGFHTQYYMQDATGGIVLYSGTYDFTLNKGDEIQVTGELTQYRGLTEIEPTSETSVEVLSTGNEVTPAMITIPDLGEDYEAELVKVDSVWIVDMNQWPAEGSNGSVDITDGTDTSYIYIDKDSDLDGWTPPSGKMNLIALNDQYTTSTPPDNGYSFRGTFREDFIDLTPTLVEFSEDTLNFASVAINGSKTLLVDMVNVGGSGLHVDSLTFGTAYYSTTMAGDTMVAAGDTLTIPVTFMPMTEEQVDDMMTVHSPSGEFMVYLTGTGYVLWPLEWRAHADSSTSEWFYVEGALENMVRGMAMNPVNGHIYAASRVGGTFVYVLDGFTGDTLGHLNTTGIEGGTYHINLVACTEDGQIIVGNLGAWGGQITRLYHYKSEAAAPTLIFDSTFDETGRMCDALGVAGTGNNLTVFASGSNNDKIVVVSTTDGTTWTRGADITLPEVNAARYGIAPVDENGDYLFVNGTVPPRYIKKDGTVLYTFDTAVIPSGTSCNYFEVETATGTRRFLGLTNGWSAGTHVVELLGEPGDNLCSDIALIEAPTEDYKVNENLNATGHAVYNNITNSLVELITNNGISSYSMDIVIPDVIKDFVVVNELEEGFEDTELGMVPNGWLAFATNVTAGDPVPAWKTHNFNPRTGEKNAYMPNYNTASDCWLVTPAIQLGIDKHYLKLYAKDDWNTAANDFGSELKVYYSTASQSNPDDFTLLETYTESDFYDIWGEIVIDLNQIQGDYAFIGFMVNNFGDPGNANAGGDNWHIDDVVLTDTLTSLTDENGDLPTKYDLSQNYPNPFNPTTNIDVALPKSGDVKITVYNMLGQQVAEVFNGKLNAGFHTFTIDASRLSSGVYFYRVKAGEYNAVKKMVLMK